MVFEWLDEGKFHRVPKLELGPPNVYFGKSINDLMPVYTPQKAYLLKSTIRDRRCFLLRVTRRPEPLGWIYVPPRAN